MKESCRVAMLSNCTVDILKMPLEDALSQKGLQAELWIGGFSQYRQLILDPESALHHFAPDFVMLYLDGEDLFAEIVTRPFDFDALQRQVVVQSRVDELENLIKRLAQFQPGTTIIINTVMVSALNTLVGLEYNSEYTLREIINRYNQSLTDLALHYPTAIVIDVDSIASWIGNKNWNDPRLWYLARIRFSLEAAQALAERYAVIISSRLGKIRKCLVLDLDNTLWGGVISEDGIHGIKLGGEGIGRAYVDFQEELRNLYQKGIILAVCSKNNLADAMEVSRNHPDMRLHEEHFAALRINWEDKASNIRSIAEELNIGLESIILIDDNPVERSWVKRALPEVFVPEWPEDPSDFKNALLELEIDHFLKLAITEEDRRRGKSYIDQAKRRSLQMASASLDDFYHSLEMQLTIGPADTYSVPRIAQLTQKTNQFNLTTRHYTDGEIARLSQSPNSIVYWVELIDRFGSSGIIGVVILRQLTEGNWFIDTFLLSCRAMGRTVENAMLGFVCQDLRAKGAAKLIGEYIPTPKNKPSADIYKNMGFQLVKKQSGGNLYELDLNKQSVHIPEWFTVKTLSIKEKENG